MYKYKKAVKDGSYDTHNCLLQHFYDDQQFLIDCMYFVVNNASKENQEQSSFKKLNCIAQIYSSSCQSQNFSWFLQLEVDHKIEWNAKTKNVSER